MNNTAAARKAAKQAEARKLARAARKSEQMARQSAIEASESLTVTPRKPWDHLGVGSFATRF